MKIFLIAMLTMVNTIDIIHVRDLFSKASENEEANLELLELTKGYSLNKNPTLYAYHAAGKMTMSNHVFWPSTKLEYFDEGKEMLEAVIEKYPKLVEVRFIRYSVQKGAPSFLEYDSNMEEDRKYVLNNMGRTKWSPNYKKEVRTYLEN